MSNVHLNSCLARRLTLLLPVVCASAFTAGCSSNSSSGITGSSAEIPIEAPGEVAGEVSDAVPLEEVAVGSTVELDVAPLPTDFPVGNNFADSRLDEASGLQRSGRLDGVYYAHNDSGSNASVYVTDVSGQALGTISVDANTGSTLDWEAITGIQYNGEPNLIVADIGDNGRNRGDINLLVFVEPDFASLATGFNTTITGSQIALSYGDGLAYDAEGIFIDTDNDTLVLVTKDTRDEIDQGIWTGSFTNAMTNGSLVLDYAGAVVLPSENLADAITDVDIHPNGEELAVLTYGTLSTGRIHLWSLSAGENASVALTGPPDRAVNVPFTGANIQAEGLSYSSDGTALLVAAEGASGSTLTIIRR